MSNAEVAKPFEPLGPQVGPYMNQVDEFESLAGPGRLLYETMISALA